MITYILRYRRSNFYSALIIIIVLNLYAGNTYSQSLRHSDSCDCRLIYFEEKENDISNKNLLTTPYDMVLHLGVKFANTDHEFYSTTSFISNNTLLTAMHCIKYPVDTIEFIELCLL